jgi:Winged helix-turn-helix DNA-binding
MKGSSNGYRFNPTLDLEILKCFARHPLLTITDVAQLVGRSYTAVAGRTKALKKLGFLEVTRAQRTNPQIYHWSQKALQLTPAGIAKVGIEVPAHVTGVHFEHTLTQSQTHASFEVGAKKHGLELYRMPETSIPVEFHYEGNHHKYNLEPDGGVGLGHPDGTWAFVLFETDCATEQLKYTPKFKQSIAKKFAAYLTVLEQGLYETHLKIENLTVLFTTTAPARLKDMRDLLHSMTTEYRRCFRFFLMPTIMSGIPQPPLGSVVTETGLAHLGEVK